MGIGDYIDRRTRQQIHDMIKEKQFLQDTVSGGRRDSTGIVDPTDPKKVIVPSGASYNLIKIGSPGAVDATVRLNGDDAAMVEEHGVVDIGDAGSEVWYLPLFDPSAPFTGPAYNTDSGWWLKRSDQDVAYRLPFELLPTQTDPEYQSQTSTGAIMRDVLIDPSGQHLIMLKSQRKFTNPYTTDYFGHTCGYPCPGGGLPANPVAFDFAIYVQYAVFKNFTLNDGTMEVDSDDQIFGSFEVDGAGYGTRPDTFVPDPLFVQYRLIETARVQSMQWYAELNGNDLRLKSIIEILKEDFVEADVFNPGNSSVGYVPSNSFGAIAPANGRKHYVYREYNLLSGSPSIGEEYSIDTSTIMPFLGFTEEGVINTWAGFKVNHSIDRIYGFNGSFIIDFAPVGSNLQRRLVFFDNDLTANSFAMTLLYSASGGASSAQSPPYFNISHAAYSTYGDLPVTIPTPEYIDVPASNVITGTLDESTVSTIENVDAGNADFMFFPNSFKKMTYNTVSSQWESETISNEPLDGSFTPSGLVYRNRLSPLSSNRAISSRIFRSQ